MKVFLTMMGGIGGDYAYLEDLYNNPPEGVSYDLCLPDEFAISASVEKFRERVKRSDLIHLHSWFPACDNFYSLNIFKNLETPLLCSFTTTIWDCHRLYWQKRPYLGMVKWFLLSRLIKPRGIIAWSQMAKLNAAKQFAYKPGRIEVIPPFIKPQPPRGNRNSQEVRIGFIGNDFKRKGGFLLLEAFEALSKTYVNLRLSIVSDQVIKDTQSTKSHGRRDRRELFSCFYPDCDIFVLPTNADFFSMAILEAMSFGIPVVTSDLYAMREIIDDGKDGFLIPPGNLKALLEKISILIENKDLREKMGNQGRQKISERFSPAVTGARLRHVYEKCLCASGQR